jgi:hypothetical protein
MSQIVESTMHEGASSKSAQEFRIHYKAAFMGCQQPNITTKGKKQLLVKVRLWCEM